MSAMDEIKNTFFQECDEQLQELETGLMRIERGDDDVELINAIFRAVHSIKGGAGAFALEDMVRFAHVFETVLDMMRSGKLATTPDVVHVMLRSSDTLADIVAAARDDRPLEPGHSDESLSALQALMARAQGGVVVEEETIDFQPLTLDLMFSLEDEAAAPAETHYAITFKPTLRSYERGNEPVLLMRALARLGRIDVTPEFEAAPLLHEVSPGEAWLWWRIDVATESGEDAIREIFEFIEDDCEITIARVPDAPAATSAPVAEDFGAQSAPAAVEEAPVHEDVATPVEKPRAAKAPGGDRANKEAQAEVSPTIRVDLDRIDRLINLVGELVINQAMLSQRVIEAGVVRSSSVGAGLNSLEQLTRELQEGVMAIRAQPVKQLFQRMARIVREVGDATGKSVALVTEGDATEVDRTVVERIADPLTHMIRNAIDHGLEKPEDRIAAGKPAQGTVKLSAGHRSGRIIIEIADDGAGINRPHVKATAIRKGLIPADAQLSDAEIDNLLFMPGFSTAQNVSAISGRGVGMDIVKRSIHALGGRISINSAPGQGTTFTLSLPLTLAILDGMVVTVGGQTLVVPLTAIIETLQPKHSGIHKLGATGQVLADRGAVVPLVDVGRELGYRKEDCDPFQSVALLVETEAGKRCAVLVDSIQDQRQVVIKSLTANYRDVPGIAAATILGDGRVALILDIDAFVARSTQRANSLIPALLAEA